MSAEPNLPSGLPTLSRAAEWRPGVPDAATPHGEIFAPESEGTGAALALALALDRLRDGEADDQQPWLWVQDARALKMGGRPYRPGLPRALRHRLVHVAVKSPEDALFAIEEGLRCRELAFVIGEIAGNPRVLDLTASRRFSLAVEKHGVPLWLVRLAARRDLGSARLRWEARAAVSPEPCWDPQAPGVASWHAELFRARSHPPGAWVLREDGAGLVADRISGSEASSTASPPRGMGFSGRA